MISENNNVMELTDQEKECITAIRKLIDDCGDDVIEADKRCFDDHSLLICIRCRNYDVVSAFDKVKKLTYARRKKYPEIFAKLYPSRLLYAFNNGGGAILKNRDAKGRHIMFLRASYWNPDTLPLEDMLGSAMLLGFESLQYKETQINGVVLIVDLQGFTLKQARNATPGNIQKYVNIILHASPIKIKGAHLLHAPTIFNMTLSLIKMFLPHKLGKRIFGHGSMESLHKWLPREILPDWMGGDLPEDEAVDHQIIQRMYTKEKDDYYRHFNVLTP